MFLPLPVPGIFVLRPFLKQVHLLIEISSSLLSFSFWNYFVTFELNKSVRMSLEKVDWGKYAEEQEKLASQVIFYLLFMFSN